MVFDTLDSWWVFKFIFVGHTSLVFNIFMQMQMQTQFSTNLAGRTRNKNMCFYKKIRFCSYNIHDKSYV